MGSAARCRVGGGRGRRVRGGDRIARRPGPPQEARPEPVRALPASLSGLRRGRRATALAGARSGDDAGVPRGRRAPGALPGTGSWSLWCPGPATGRPWPGVRRHGGLARGPHQQERRRRAHAARLADGRGDHHQGRRRRRAAGRSGSTRSATAGASVTSRSSSTTTRAGWCGPPRAVRRRRWSASSTSSAMSAVGRSSSCRPTGPNGSGGSSGGGHRRRSCVSTRSTSWPGRPRPSTRSGARSGTRPGGTVRRPSRRISRAPATRSGRTPQDLTGRQQRKLAWIAATNEPLYRTYLLKEELRMVFALRGTEGRQLLDGWLSWARRCQISAFIELARKVAKNRPGIEATLAHGLSNARVDAVNTKIRLLTPDRLRVPLRGGPDRPRDAQPRRPVSTAPGPLSTHGWVRRGRKSPVADPECEDAKKADAEHQGGDERQRGRRQRPLRRDPLDPARCGEPSDGDLIRVGATIRARALSVVAMPAPRDARRFSVSEIRPSSNVLGSFRCVTKRPPPAPGGARPAPDTGAPSSFRRERRRDRRSPERADPRGGAGPAPRDRRLTGPQRLARAHHALHSTPCRRTERQRRHRPAGGRDAGDPGPPPEDAATGVDEDAVAPGVEPVWFTERWQAPPDGDEPVLKSVIGVLGRPKTPRAIRVIQSCRS